MLRKISLTRVQAQERERLLQLHRQLNENLACLEEVKRSNPGFEVMIDAYRDLVIVTAHAACEAVIAMELEAMHSIRDGKPSG